MKTTSELLNEIKTAPSMKVFFENNTEELTNSTLTDYLKQLLTSKSMTRSEAIRASDLSQDYAYQIFSGRKKPSRDKLIRLALGMKLSLDETSRLFVLADTGALYPRLRRDAVIIFCIEHHLSVMTANELLDSLGFYTLA